MKSINEIIETITNELADNVTVHHVGYCIWEISGHYTDGVGDRRHVKITTRDEELATGWREAPEDGELYKEYRRKWADLLVDRLELVNAY